MPKNIKGATVAEESNKEERVQVKSGVQAMEGNVVEILFKVKEETRGSSEQG